MRGDAAPHGALLAWGIAAGVAGGLSLTAFYIALSRGAMGASAAVSGLLAAAIPGGLHAVAGWDRRASATARLRHGGNRHLADRNAAPRRGFRGQLCNRRIARETMALAILAGVGFGFYFIALKMAGPAGVIWPMASAQNRQPQRLLAHASREYSAFGQECRARAAASTARAIVWALGNRAAGYIRQSALCGGDARGTAGCGGGAGVALPRVDHSAGGACSGRVAHAPPGDGNGRPRRSPSSSSRYRASQLVRRKNGVFSQRRQTASFDEVLKCSTRRCS